MIGVLLFRLTGAIAALFVQCLGSAHHELAAHILLVVKLGDGALCLIHGLHLHKGKSLGLLGEFVGHDFDVLHLADSVEQLEEITLRGVKRKVADIDARGGDFHHFGLAKTRGAFGFPGPGLAFSTKRRVRAIGLGRSRRLFLAVSAAQEGSDALPEGFLYGFRWGAAFLAIARSAPARTSGTMVAPPGRAATSGWCVFR